MQLKFIETTRIISAHEYLIGKLYTLPDGTQLAIRKLQLAPKCDESGKQIGYTIHVIFDYPDDNLHLYAEFDSILSQFNIPSQTGI